ncbi:hypothetical protein KI387_033483, partial [Taxus chinensis]
PAPILRESPLDVGIVILVDMAHVQSTPKILIAGGGIAGLATALALHRLGLKSITVLEQASSLRVTGASLTIWDNGWRALDALGVADTLRSQHIKLQRVETLLASRGLTKPLSLDGHEVRCVKRKDLLQTLAQELPPHTIQFGSKISAIHRTHGNSSIVELEDGKHISPKVVIGCDGVNSAVAKWLGFGAPNLAGRSAFLGLAKFPEGHHFEHKTFQIWGNGIRAAFAPCNENDAFWFVARKSNPRLDAEIAYKEEILREEALHLAENLRNKELVELIKRSVPGSLSLAVFKYRYLWPFMAGNARQGNVTVAGDALHPMTPELGQGGSLALEDSVTLGRCLGEMDLEKPGDVEAALNKYVQERKVRAFGMGVGSSVS